MPMIVPGLGYAGLGQMTRATQTLFSQAMRGGARRARGTATKRRKKRARRSASSSKRSRSKPARLVRGSAAAKRYMAKIRKMRKR